MTFRLGIRREDKNEWERRAPLAPDAVSRLVAQGVEVLVEPSPRRIFTDLEYARAGARIAPDLSACTLVLGVKEIPPARFRPGGAYCFFSHTIKGQPYNMGMLARLRELGCTLLDYELVKDDQGRRLIFFGRHAGLAGMLDSLWALGRRLAEEGLANPFEALRPAHAYAGLEEVREAVAAVGRRIAAEGLEEPLRPLAIGVTGFGNVSRGAKEILDLLPCLDLSPAEFLRRDPAGAAPADRVLRIFFNEPDLYVPLDPARPFDLQDYYARPEGYRARFAPFLGRLTVLVNGIFWAPRYPRLAERADLAALFAAGRPRLRVVGDISCDPDGSLACTVRETHPGDPVYVYDPMTGEARPGFAGPGLAVLAVGNLPCELPLEASRHFSAALEPLLPGLAAARWEGALEASGFAPHLRRAVILWRGGFAPEHAGLTAHLP